MHLSSSADCSYLNEMCAVWPVSPQCSGWPMTIVLLSALSVWPGSQVFQFGFCCCDKYHNQPPHHQKKQTKQQQKVRGGKGLHGLQSTFPFMTVRYCVLKFPGKRRTYVEDFSRMARWLKHSYFYRIRRLHIKENVILRYLRSLHYPFIA